MSEKKKTNINSKPDADKTNLGNNKAEMYGWVIRDVPGELQWINKKLINIDFDYQRDTNITKTNEIAKSWSWFACGAIIVARRDNKYWAIDGQHRVVAAKKLSKIQELPCIVFKGTSKKTEAQGFGDSNSLRKPVTAIGKFKAALVAEDENAIFVKSILDKNHLTLARHATKTHEVQCVALLLRMASLNRESFISTISFVTRLCDGLVPVMDRIVQGVYYIDSHVENGLKNKRLTDKMISIGPNRIIEQIQHCVSYLNKTGAKVFAQGIIDAVNKKTPEKYHFKFLNDLN